MRMLYPLHLVVFDYSSILLLKFLDFCPPSSRGVATMLSCQVYELLADFVGVAW